VYTHLQVCPNVDLLEFGSVAISDVEVPGSENFAAKGGLTAGGEFGVALVVRIAETGQEVGGATKNKNKICT